MKEMPDIVTRNKDVEHIMHAACQYGLYAQGKRKQKLFSMLVTTDIHECPRQLSNAVDYLNYYDAIDCGICLGDVQQSDFLKTDGIWYHNAIAHAKKPFMTLLGNHDVGNSRRVDICGSSQEAFDKFIKPTAHLSGIEGFDNPHFIRLFDDYKLAIIGLDPYGAEPKLDESGNYTAQRGHYTFSKEEIYWFADALAAVPEGYGLVVALHGIPFEADVTECAWTQKGARLYYPEEDHHGGCEFIPDMIAAWERGEKICKSYEPWDRISVPVIEVNCDFSARGKGDFVCYIVGHYHRDILGKCKKYPNQNIISFPATAADNWQNYCSDLPREHGTKSEDAITVMSVHPEKRQIRLVRIGSNFTLDLEERTHTVISY